MGTYLNPGKEQFERAVHSRIYVDKTGMLSCLNAVINTEQKYVAVSRPRRFGKTMAANMICAFYDKTAASKELFEGMAVAKDFAKHPGQRSSDRFEVAGSLDDAAKRQAEESAGRTQSGWDRYLNRFNVVRINMIDFVSRSRDIGKCIELLQKRVLKELCRNFQEVDFFDADDLMFSMEDIYHQTGQQFVIVIDEWDCIFREFKEDTDGQRLYLDFLRDWLKDKSYIALAYITGILPIKKYGQHSALNMFGEYSMLQPQQLAEYAGFTEPEVREICELYELDFEQVRDWYDGYRLRGAIPVSERKAAKSGEYEGNLFSIYSPVSVVNSALNGNLCNYWNETETAEALKEYIRRNYDGLKEDVAVLMQGRRIPCDVTTYQNDMTTFHSKDDIFTLLIHLGYLGYDSVTKEIFIPNREVEDVFRQTTKGEEWDYLFQTLKRSQKLLEATWTGDEDEVARLVEDAHMRAGNLTYNSEAALSYAVRLAYFNAEQYYTLIPEMQAGRGYADLAYIPSPKYPDKPAILVELKWNKDAETAMTQILDRRYPDSLEKYRGNIILVAIDYDKEVTSGSRGYKHHSCRIGRA